jgi:hypothetical protein
MGKQGISVGQLDRNLVPRIEQYALNKDVNDVDALVDHLRRSYKEYQRRQIGALRQMVVKAVQIVQRKSLSKPELVLQVGERGRATGGAKTAARTPLQHRCIARSTSGGAVFRLGLLCLQ